MKKNGKLQGVLRTIGEYALSVGVFIAIWWIYVAVKHVPAYILPSPPKVWNSLEKMFVKGTVYPHLWTDAVSDLSADSAEDRSCSAVRYLVRDRTCIKSCPDHFHGTVSGIVRHDAGIGIDPAGCQKPDEDLKGIKMADLFTG